MILGTATPTTQAATLKKALDVKIWEPGATCVNGVVFAVGDDVLVEGIKVLRIAGVAKPEFVHYRGTRGPNPVEDVGPVAYRHRVVEGWIHHGMIFSHAVVVAVPEHAIEHVLAVDTVVDFRHPVVARVGIGEGAKVGRRGRGCVLYEAPRAGDWSRRRVAATHDVPADRTHRHAGLRQSIDSIHHAVFRTSCRSRFGNGSGNRVADERT